MSDFGAVGEGSVPRREDQEEATAKPEMMLKFHRNVTSEMPKEHFLRKENLVVFPLSPCRKTVGDVVERVKEKYKIPCDLYMKTMDGALLTPDHAAEKLPSYERVRLLQQEEGMKFPHQLPKN